MSTARRAYAAPAPADRTRSPRVMEREASRRIARMAKYTPAPLDVEQLQLELTTAGVAR